MRFNCFFKQTVRLLLIGLLELPLFAGSCGHTGNDLPQLACPVRQATCPLDPSLQHQTGFCQTIYQRDGEYLSECGPTKPGPICPVSACVNQSTLSPAPFPFNPGDTCEAMQLIQRGIQESSSGTWDSFARINLDNQLPNIGPIVLGLTPTGQVRYYYYADQSRQWIVFLGSVTVSNWITDIKNGLVDSPTLGMKLHRGFHEAATSIYPLLKSLIDQNPNKKIYLTGHSLGAAVATITALLLAADNETISSLITFGQPQLTDSSGVSTFSESFSKKVPLIRFINHNDQIPFLLASLKNFYVHFGPEVRLETDDTMTPSETVFAILSEPENTRTLAEGDKSGTADHPPSAYISSLNQLFCKI